MWNLFYSNKFTFYEYQDIQRFFDRSFSLNQKDLNQFRRYIYYIYFTNKLENLSQPMKTNKRHRIKKSCVR